MAIFFRLFLWAYFYIVTIIPYTLLFPFHKTLQHKHFLRHACKLFAYIKNTTHFFSKKLILLFPNFFFFTIIKINEYSLQKHLNLQKNVEKKIKTTCKSEITTDNFLEYFLLVFFFFFSWLCILLFFFFLLNWDHNI